MRGRLAGVLTTGESWLPVAAAFVMCAVVLVVPPVAGVVSAAGGVLKGCGNAIVFQSGIPVVRFVRRIATDD